MKADTAKYLPSAVTAQAESDQSHSWYVLEAYWNQGHIYIVILARITLYKQLIIPMWLYF